MQSQEPTSEIHFKARIEIDYPNVIQRSAAIHLGHWLRKFLRSGEDVAIVSDDTLAELYWPDLAESLRDAGYGVPPLFIIPAGESSKSAASLHRLVTEMLSSGVHRRSVLLALGGGVVCDTTGFLAAVYMRGIGYINIPTSLIAQVDAAIGGKVAVNHPLCKNLIGNFYHPRAVIIDPAFLSTLPPDEFRNGLAEIVKIAMVASPLLFEWLEQESKGPFHAMATTAAMDKIIDEAVRRKIELLLPDPFEADLRRVLNFGHTFAHALEVAEHFRLRHGFAVSIGMCIAASIALRRKIMRSEDAVRLFSLLNAFGLPTQAPAIDPAEVWAHAQCIRRIRANHFHFVVPKAIGSMTFIDDLTQDEFVLAYQQLGGIIPN